MRVPFDLCFLLSVYLFFYIFLLIFAIQKSLFEINPSAGNPNDYIHMNGS